MPRLRRSAASAMTRHLARAAQTRNSKRNRKPLIQSNPVGAFRTERPDTRGLPGRKMDVWPLKNALVIASRKSPLALRQAEEVRAALQKLYPQSEISILGITTRGDQWLDQPLSKIGGKGLFIKELEQALADGRADLAVHSLKD